jgi:hypothetical protein
MPYAKRRKSAPELLFIGYQSGLPTTSKREKAILGRSIGVPAVTLFEELHGMIAVREGGLP